MNPILHTRITGVAVVLLILIFAHAVIPSVLSANNILFSKTIVGASNESITPTAIQVDDADNIYLAGEIVSTKNSSAILLKYDSTGSLQWTNAWGGDNGTTYAGGLALGPSGVVYLAGFTSSFGNGGGDIFLLKLYANGSLSWVRTWGGPLLDAAKGVVVDPFGNVFVVGATYSYGSSQGEAFILKFDPSGTLLWARILGGANSSAASGVAANSLGVFVAGFENGFGAGEYDAFVLAINTTGSIIFQRAWGGSGPDIANAIALDSSSNTVYLAGSTDSYGVAGDAFILKFDSLYNLNWQHAWGGNGTDGARGITIDSLGDIYVVGDTHSFGATNGTAFILKLDSGGNLSYGYTWGKPYGIYCPELCTSASGVTTDSLGNAYVAGFVRDGPTYGLGVGNSSIGLPNLPVSTPNFNASPAGTALRIPFLILTHPNLNTTFTVGQAGFFFKISNESNGVGTLALSAIVLLALVVPVVLLWVRHKRLHPH